MRVKPLVALDFSFGFENLMMSRAHTLFALNQNIRCAAGANPVENMAETSVVDNSLSR